MIRCIPLKREAKGDVTKYKRDSAVKADGGT